VGLLQYGLQLQMQLATASTLGGMADSHILPDESN